MSKRRTIYKEDYYKGKKIQVHPDQKQYCDKKILKKLDNVFHETVNNRSKNLCIRMDLHFPASGNADLSNNKFSTFAHNLLRSEHRQGDDINYFAVREQKRADHQHYHMVLFADGHVRQSPYHIIENAKRIWSNLNDGNGSVHYAGSCMLRKDDPDYEDKLNKCYHSASYLAKINTKDKNDGYREMFGSRAPHKQYKEQ